MSINNKRIKIPSIVFGSNKITTDYYSKCKGNSNKDFTEHNGVIVQFVLAKLAQLKSRIAALLPLVCGLIYLATFSTLGLYVYCAMCY